MIGRLLAVPMRRENFFGVLFALVAGSVVSLTIHFSGILSAINDIWALIVIAISPPISVIAALLTAEKLAPTRSSADEFWFARIRAMHQAAGPPSRSSAIAELCKELRRGRNEASYLAAVLKHVEDSSVWAICGRKSDTVASSFLDANEKSKGLGHHVERIFFSPNDRREALPIHEAIDRHLRNRMVVRAFSAKDSTEMARREWRLPPGFGMTLLGDPGDSNADEPSDPEKLHTILVHWGGVDHIEPHYGVLLSDPAWKENLIDLFKEIRATSHIVESGSINDFLNSHSHYKWPWWKL